jgi:phenylacetate-CoA ligase
MRRIERISGRTDDMLIIRGVNVFPTQIEELILKQAALAPHYHLEIFREGHLDSLTVNVELQIDVESHQAKRDREAAELTQLIKSYIGVTTTVVVHPPSSLERSAGKAKRVSDRRRPG